jgi:hypothetical protein
VKAVATVRVSWDLAGAALILLLAAQAGWGSVYHVSPAGSDANPGGAAKPWRTLAHSADAAAPGDTVLIAAGTWHERLMPCRSGEPGKPITYASEGGVAVIDGQGVELPDDLTGVVEVNGARWIVLDGLRVINAGPYRDNAGIMVLDAADIVIRRCSTADTSSSGIGVWSSARVTIDQCSVERAASGGYQESLTVAGTDGFTVSGCRVSDCRKEGICIKDGSARGAVRGNDVRGAYSVGIYVDAWDKHTFAIEVSGNRVHHNDGNGIALASEMGGVLEDVSVHDNLCYANRFLGIQVSTNGDSPTHPMRGVAVVNNTCAGNGWADWGGGIALDNPEARNVLIRNNICSANRYFQLLAVDAVPAGAAEIDHNLIDSFGGTEGEILGDAAVQGDPLFRDAPRADFHLRAGSPAIGAGSANGAPSRDFDGRPRQRAEDSARGAGDIGALVHGSS